MLVSVETDMVDAETAVVTILEPVRVEYWILLLISVKP
jgi:hypothetical protein